jgi:hypothetical protein
MAQQSNTATLADETGRQRRDTARTDPTAPLCLGTATDTDDPVTLARTEPFDPILITGKTGAGKTTLAHHIADQQLHPNSGLCYVSKIDPSITDLFQRTPTTHECDRIAPDGSWDPTTAVPDDIGTNPTIHGVQLDTDSDRNTTLVRALLGQVRQNRAEQTPTDPPPTRSCLTAWQGSTGTSLRSTPCWLKPENSTSTSSSQPRD